MSWVLLCSFGLPGLKWLQESTAAVRHDVDCCPTAGHVPQHFHGRNPSAFMTPWCCSHPAQDELRGFASTVLNPCLCTGIAPLCILDFVFLAARGCWRQNWQEGLALSQMCLPLQACWGPRAGLAYCMLAVLCWGGVSCRWITALLWVYPFQCAGTALCSPCTFWTDVVRLSLWDSSEEVQCQDLEAVLATNSSAVLECEWAICPRLSWCGNHKQCSEKLPAWAGHCFFPSPKSKAGLSRAAKAVRECIAASQGKWWRSSQ